MHLFTTTIYLLHNMGHYRYKRLTTSHTYEWSQLISGINICHNKNGAKKNPLASFKIERWLILEKCKHLHTYTVYWNCICLLVHAPFDRSKPVQTTQISTAKKGKKKSRTAKRRRIPTGLTKKMQRQKPEGIIKLKWIQGMCRRGECLFL